MKKEIKIFLLISIMLMFSISLISAGFFSDFFGKNTGQVAFEDTGNGGILGRILEAIKNIFTREPELSLTDPNTEKLVSGSEIVVEGRLIVTIIDDFENEKSETIYQLEEFGNEKMHILEFIGDAPYLLTGSQIRVRGIESQSKLLVDAVSPQESESGSSLLVLNSEEPRTTGDKRVAVVMYNFQNDIIEPYSTQQLNETLFTRSNSVSNFYEESSYDMLKLSGNVFGWYTLPQDRPVGSAFDRIACGGFGEWTRTAVELASEDTGINISDYDYIIGFVPYADCSVDAIAIVNGKISFINGFNKVNVIAHELGHNLGTLHASTLSCGDKILGDSCTKNEYGNNFDVMGKGKWGLHFQSKTKNFFGWINEDSIIRIFPENDGIYTLRPLETNSGNRMAIVATPTSYIRIDYRKPIGFDNTAEIEVNNGLMIYNSQGSLLDMSPWNFFNNAVLHEPSDNSVETFIYTDELGDVVNIGPVISTENNEITFRITYGDQEDVTPPRVWVGGGPFTPTRGEFEIVGHCLDQQSGCDISSYRYRLYDSEPAQCSTDSSTYTLSNPVILEYYNWVCGHAKDNVGLEGFSEPREFNILPPEEEPTTCTDTDGGINYEERGTVTFEEDGKTKTLTDSCELGGNILNEYYCDGNDSAVEKYSCPEDCKNGACQSINMLYVGDVDGNGIVNIIDAQIIARFVEGLPISFEIRNNNSDVTLDGSITIEDANLVAQCSVGLAACDVRQEDYGIPNSKIISKSDTNFIN